MRPPVTASLQFDPVNVRLLGSFRIGQVTLATLLPFVGGCGSQHGKVTKQTVLRVQMGMSISDAKMILGPPTHESEVLNLARAAATFHRGGYRASRAFLGGPIR